MRLMCKCIALLTIYVMFISIYLCTMYLYCIVCVDTWTFPTLSNAHHWVGLFDNGTAWEWSDGADATWANSYLPYSKITNITYYNIFMEYCHNINTYGILY